MQAIFGFIAVPLGWIMRVCYDLVDNYFVALLMFALIMQVVLLPFSIAQQKNSIRQAKLAPKIMAIKNRYAGRTDAATQQKMQQEMQQLYTEEKFNPMAGCLPLLIQMPILFSLYYVVTDPLQYISRLTAERITEIKDFLTGTLQMTVTDQGTYSISTLRILNEMKEAAGETWQQVLDVAPELADAILPDMQFLFIDMSQIPNAQPSFWSWYLLVPVLTVVFQLLTQKITKMFTYQSPETVEAQKSGSMRIMNWSMPLLSAWIAYIVPVGIGIYWIFRGIIMAVQQIILSKVFPAPKFTEEDYKKAEKEMKTGRPVREKSKIPPKSLHHIDDEEYQKKYEERLAAAEAEVAKEKEEAAAKDGVKKPKMKD